MYGDEQDRREPLLQTVHQSVQAKVTNWEVGVRQLVWAGGYTNSIAVIRQMTQCRKKQCIWENTSISSNNKSDSRRRSKVSVEKVERICSANSIFILDGREHQAGILGVSAARGTFRSYMASTMRVLMSSPKAFSSEQINVGFILPLKGWDHKISLPSPKLGKDPEADGQAIWRL